jgi:hypothetical protein
MEKLTQRMESIALKTENETIFMRIITVVTLFFLPGTFVAASCMVLALTRYADRSQTLMSTDIIRFQDNGNLMKSFSWVAFLVYLLITAPIMIATFVAASWYHKRITKKTEADRAGNEKTGTGGLLLPI